MGSRSRPLLLTLQKLSDFGLAKEAPKKPILATCVGTPGYVAPQVRDKQKYGKGADVFSLGAILYAMVVGSDPPKSVVFDQEGKPVFDYARVSCIDDSALDLLKKMMCRDEQDRILLDGEFPWRDLAWSISLRASASCPSPFHSEIDQHPFMEAAQEKALEKMGLDASLLRSCSRERNSDKENQPVWFTGAGRSIIRTLCRRLVSAVFRQGASTIGEAAS
jgi:serine/threonine protein kinase